MSSPQSAADAILKRAQEERKRREDEEKRRQGAAARFENIQRATGTGEFARGQSKDVFAESRVIAESKVQAERELITERQRPITVSRGIEGSTRREGERGRKVTSVRGERPVISQEQITSRAQNVLTRRAEADTETQRQERLATQQRQAFTFGRESVQSSAELRAQQAPTAAQRATQRDIGLEARQRAQEQERLKSRFEERTGILQPLTTTEQAARQKRVSAPIIQGTTIVGDVSKLPAGATRKVTVPTEGGDVQVTVGKSRLNADELAEVERQETEGKRFVGKDDTGLLFFTDLKERSENVKTFRADQAKAEAEFKTEKAKLDADNKKLEQIAERSGYFVDKTRQDVDGEIIESVTNFQPKNPDDPNTKPLIIIQKEGRNAEQFEATRADTKEVFKREGYVANETRLSDGSIVIEFEKDPNFKKPEREFTIGEQFGRGFFGYSTELAGGTVEIAGALGGRTGLLTPEQEKAALDKGLEIKKANPAFDPDRPVVGGIGGLSYVVAAAGGSEDARKQVLETRRTLIERPVEFASASAFEILTFGVGATKALKAKPSAAVRRDPLARAAGVVEKSKTEGVKTTFVQSRAEKLAGLALKKAGVKLDKGEKLTAVAVRTTEKGEAIPVRRGEQAGAFEVVSGTGEGQVTRALVTEKSVFVPREATSVQEALTRTGRTAKPKETSIVFERETKGVREVGKTEPTSITELERLRQASKVEKIEGREAGVETLKLRDTKAGVTRVTTREGKTTTFIAEQSGELRRTKTEVVGSVEEFPTGSLERNIISEAASKFFKTPKAIKRIEQAALNRPRIVNKVKQTARLLRQPFANAQKIRDRIEELVVKRESLIEERQQVQQQLNDPNLPPEQLAPLEQRLVDIQSELQQVAENAASARATLDKIRANIDEIKKRRALKRSDLLGAKQEQAIEEQTRARKTQPTEIFREQPAGSLSTVTRQVTQEAKTQRGIESTRRAAIQKASQAQREGLGFRGATGAERRGRRQIRIEDEFTEGRRPPGARQLPRNPLFGATERVTGLGIGERLITRPQTGLGRTPSRGLGVVPRPVTGVRNVPKTTTTERTDTGFVLIPKVTPTTVEGLQFRQVQRGAQRTTFRTPTKTTPFRTSRVTPRLIAPPILFPPIGGGGLESGKGVEPGDTSGRRLAVANILDLTGTLSIRGAGAQDVAAKRLTMDGSSLILGKKKTTRRRKK